MVKTAAFVVFAILFPIEAFLSTPHSDKVSTPSVKLGYANREGENDGIDSSWRNVIGFQNPRQHEHEDNNDRHVPQRAISHVRNISNAEQATKAGYVIRESSDGGQTDGQHIIERNSRNKQRRPLRRIRRIVRGNNLQSLQQSTQDIRIEDMHQIRVRHRPNNQRSSRLSLSRQPQLDEFLDKSERLSVVGPDEQQRKGARRVTFKATRESQSHSIVSKPFSTLTEYMTQPVSQYSLLSFHDEKEDSKQRRWLVRRLTNKESQRYMDSSNDEEIDMDESNLFRLAVPLLPIIGWDLTPVIDLEVTVGSNNDSEEEDDTNDVVATNIEELDAESSNSKWRPLRGIRKRIRQQRENGVDEFDDSSVVRIRSLSVSLLSTQEEVKQVFNVNDNGKGVQRADSNMQKEAIDMVSKVEEWLRPHILFEAELSWDDNVNGKAGSFENESTSTVIVKSTAITSLTIPKIPSDVLRRAVPSAFLVKRLGAALTSQALAICLPRFLRQLEKDYDRWWGKNEDLFAS